MKYNKPREKQIKFTFLDEEKSKRIGKILEDMGILFEKKEEEVKKEPTKDEILSLLKEVTTYDELRNVISINDFKVLSGMRLRSVEKIFAGEQISYNVYFRIKHLIPLFKEIKVEKCQ